MKLNTLGDLREYLIKLLVFTFLIIPVLLYIFNSVFISCVGLTLSICIVICLLVLFNVKEVKQ